MLESFDHPELIIAGPRFEHGASILNGIGALIAAGECMHVGDPITFGKSTEPLIVGAVDRRHYVNGTFATWPDYYGELTLSNGRGLEAVQIVVPKSMVAPGQFQKRYCAAQIDPHVAVTGRAARAARRRHDRR